MLLQFLLFYLLIGTTVAVPPTPEQNVQICDNEQCKAAADILNKAMNKSVDPCEDFYAYACGGWESNFPLPSNREVWNLDKIVENDAIHAVKEILEEEEKSDDSVPLMHEKMWYKSCMDTDRIEEEGVKPVAEILTYQGGWPIIMGNNWNSDDYSWQKIHEYYSSFREMTSLFDIQVAADQRNYMNNYLTLFKPSESLYETLLKNNSEAIADEKYTEFVKNVALIFAKSANDIEPDEEEILKDIEELLAFERSLHLIKSTAKETEDLESSRIYITIKELQDFYEEEEHQNETSKINWVEVFAVVYKNVVSIIVDESTNIAVDDKYYIRKLFNLLDTTPNRVIVNYVHWKFIASSLKYLNKEVRDLLNELTPMPVKDTQERWVECISDMKFRIGYKLAYINKYTSDETKRMMNDMANELRSAMLDEIEHSDWIDPDTKEETMIKLHGLTWLLGSPLSNIPRGHINRMLGGLMITRNYFDNVQTARKFWMNFNLMRVRFRNFRKYVRLDPLLSQSIYDHSRNLLVLSSAQLANPLLQSTLPLSMHYGYMAPTLGHLMAQTMEKELHASSYMAPWSTYLGETYKSYEPKTACLERQYNNYSVGPATVDDNMFNAIGLKVAYDTFQANVERESVEKLPEFEDLTNDQLFFVSYALKYCQAASSKYLEEHDPAFYTPNAYKVIGTLSNLEYFAKAFNCPADSYMNPEEKCII